MPSILSRLFGGAGAMTRAQNPSSEHKASRTGALFAMQQLGIGRFTPRPNTELTRQGFERNPVVYRCVRMIAESAATIPWLAYEEDGEHEDHPFLDLLRRPNPVESAASFLERLYCDLMLAGNAYVELAEVDGAPRELHILRPDRMSVVPGPNGWPSAYEYAVGAQKISFRVDGEGQSPVLHLKLVHPLDDHYGFAPLAAAQTPLDVHNAAAQWNKALLENAARPSGALVYTNKSGALLSEDQVARLRAELDETFSGARNAGRPMLLEGGLDWKALSLSPKDMDFIAAKSDAAREIALAFGVPPLLLGLPGDNTFSNYAEANRAFWRQCVIPLVRRTQQAFAGFLQPRYGALRLEADLDRIDALAGEREAEWRRIGAAGFLSDAEKREALGWRGGGKRKFAPSRLRRKEDDWEDWEGGGDDGASGPGGGGHWQSQPRVPAGSPDGGQWTDGEGIIFPRDEGDYHSIGEYDNLLNEIADINGFTRHGINQAINRGVDPRSILDALKNPLQVVIRPDGSAQYRGSQATVVLRPDGYVITVWPR